MPSRSSMRAAAIGPWKLTVFEALRLIHALPQ